VRGATWILAALFLLPLGCYRSHGRRGPDAGLSDAAPGDTGPVDAGHDAPPAPDAGPRPDSGGDCDAGPVILDGGGEALVVDRLFVVDNSGSMAEEQRALAAQFPRMVRMLVTGDLDEDGGAEFEPVTDLRVGVITTELPTGAVPVGGCEIDTAEGDDGVLRTVPEWRARDCTRTYPPFLGFRPGAAVERFVRDFACVATVGTEGCGFEQPLDAALKALTPSTSSVRFPIGVGQGDGPNADFAREGSVLAVIVVTDEDDCSAADLELFDVESERYPPVDVRGGLRCFRYPEALQPLSRYAEGFAQLRPDDPDGFVFAAITGVPPDLVADPDAIDYDALLADPRMQEEIDPDHPERLRPACDVPGTGFALPARRVVEVVRSLGDNGIVQSICDDSFTEALRGITSRLGRVIRRRRCR